MSGHLYLKVLTEQNVKAFELWINLYQYGLEPFIGLIYWTNLSSTKLCSNGHSVFCLPNYCHCRHWKTRVFQLGLVKAPCSYSAEAQKGDCDIYQSHLGGFGPPISWHTPDQLNQSLWGETPGSVVFKALPCAREVTSISKMEG